MTNSALEIFIISPIWGPALVRMTLVFKQSNLAVETLEATTVGAPVRKFTSVNAPMTSK